MWSVVRSRFKRDPTKYHKALREVWEKKMRGPTMPTFEDQFLQTSVPPKERKTEIERGIVKGDSVYLTTGPKKGSIVEVMNYMPESDSVIVANITEKRVIPKSKWPEGNTSHVIEFPKFIPVKDVLLAGKEKDEEGRINYIVAKEIQFGKEYYDDRYRKWIPRRFIKYHEDIEIPWPNPPHTFEDGELSTPEHIAHERTYEPQTIAKPPFPQAALDQLRNPYSKNKRQLVTKYHLHRFSAPEMPLTVEQRIYLAKKEQERNEPKKLEPLSEEVQDFIGAKMAERFNKIESEAMRAHLDALSKVKIPDFEKTMQKIQNQQQQEQQQGEESK